MNHPPADILLEYLIDQDLVTDPTQGSDWPGYTSSLPVDVDEGVCLYDTPGDLQGIYQATGETIEKFGIQIRCRSTSHLSGMRKMMDIKDALAQIRRSTVVMSEGEGNTYRIDAVKLMTGILCLGTEDQTGKRAFTLNVTMTVVAV